MYKVQYEMVKLCNSILYQLVAGVKFKVQEKSLNQYQLWRHLAQNFIPKICFIMFSAYALSAQVCSYYVSMFGMFSMFLDDN